MICDVLQQLTRYRNVLPHFEAIHAFLNRKDLLELPLQRMDLVPGIYAILSEYQTRPADELRWEAHRRYLDIQYLIWGEERIGYSSGPDFQCIEPYDELKDIAFYTGHGYELPLGRDYFVILFPGEYHMPGIMTHSPEMVRKVVIKVLWG